MASALVAVAAAVLALGIRVAAAVTAVTVTGRPTTVVIFRRRVRHDGRLRPRTS
jgi:hypothetical protein